MTDEIWKSQVPDPGEKIDQYLREPSGEGADPYDVSDVLGDESVADDQGIVWTPDQREALEAIRQFLDRDNNITEERRFGLYGVAGTGKAQPLDSPVITPNGWVNMGNIEVGDLVLGGDGEPVEVVGVYPQGVEDIYQVTFQDGSTVECTGDHLWATKTCLDRSKDRSFKVRTTEEIQDTLRCNHKHEKRNHHIPVTQPVKFPEKDLPIHPYLMGVIIGDGSISKGNFSVTSGDEWVIEECQRLAPDGVQFKRSNSDPLRWDMVCPDETGKGSGTGFVGVPLEGQEILEFDSIHEAKEAGFTTYLYEVTSGKGSCSYRGYLWSRTSPESTNPLKKYLDEMGLRVRSEDKFIPEEYMLGSIDQRIALIQGLMDADGTVEKNGKGKSLSTTSEQIAGQFQRLVQSLGGTCTIQARHTNYYDEHGEKHSGLKSYRCRVCLENEIIPFRLPRKRDSVQGREKYFPRRIIDDVQKVGEREAQCIKVNNPDGLYLTNDFVVTHNTTVIQQICAEYDGSVAMSAPTHKAVGVLSSMADEFPGNPEFGTIHSLLRLRKKRDGGEEYFEPDTKKDPPILEHDLVILDECSMVGDDLWGYLTDAQNRFNFDLICMGDPLQLPPVSDDNEESPTFSLHDEVELTTIVRHEGALGQTVARVRENIFEEAPQYAEEVEDEHGKVRTYGVKAKWEEVILESIDDNDKVLAFTNKTVDRINDRVRAHLYGEDADPFVEGERMVATTTFCPDDEVVMHTEDECKILEVEPHEVAIEDIVRDQRRQTSFTKDQDKTYLDCWWLKVQLLADGRVKTMLTMDETQEPKRDRYLSEYANKKKWGWFWPLKDRFVQLRPPFATTIHKSQGSSFERVFLNQEDLVSTCNHITDKTAEFRNRLMYVAYSRASDQLHVYSNHYQANGGVPTKDDDVVRSDPYTVSY